YLKRGHYARDCLSRARTFGPAPQARQSEPLVGFRKVAPHTLGARIHPANVVLGGSIAALRERCPVTERGGEVAMRVGAQPLLQMIDPLFLPPSGAGQDCSHRQDCKTDR